MSGYSSRGCYNNALSLLHGFNVRDVNGGRFASLIGKTKCHKNRCQAVFERFLHQKLRTQTLKSLAQ